MTEVIYTERLIIRPILLSDYDNWLDSQNNRLPSQYKHDDGFKDISGHNFEWFKEYIEECSFLASEDKIRVFGIFDKESSTYIGLIDVITLSRANVDWAEIGYSINNQYWKNGYAYEAVSAFIPYLKDDLKFSRIDAVVSIDNIPSKNLLKKLSFSYECVRKEFIYEFGKWADQDVFYINLHD